MEKNLAGLTPAPLWQYFEEICGVPRPSKREEKIVAYLRDFFTRHGVEHHVDAVGNIVARKPATRGREDATPLILQAHLDMVCEQDRDGRHDFDRDPIVPVIDGEWVKAAGGTTLGADDGIGVAACMAVLTSSTIQHGPLECLFTVDEESGMTGAFALQPDFLQGKMLLNLDSEDEGELFIGCAGGINTTARLPYNSTPVPPGRFAVQVEVSKLLGGHSGDDINKGRANAIKILARFLWMLNETKNVRVATFEGGDKRNAIPREARAVIVIAGPCREQVITEFQAYASAVKATWIMDPDICLTIDEVEVPARALDEASTRTLLDVLHACPHGVFATSFRVPGLVETSTNLASVKFDEEESITIATSQRSDIDSEKMNIADTVASVFRLAGAHVAYADSYPGWSPDTSSPLSRVMIASHERLFGKTPVVRSIHAGLECGLFLEKYPDMDMVSFGPTLRDVHSPRERVHVGSVERWWKHLVDVLENV
ncbi:MAG: aminoacyl-histidine dipeptidase [Odoribacteraceae bacterium]|jgi:dipeptidase D|nr:aminoacyl-histidine dipeptidase [Odoribacteraceae bacterium]